MEGFGCLLYTQTFGSQPHHKLIKSSAVPLYNELCVKFFTINQPGDRLHTKKKPSSSSHRKKASKVPAFFLSHRQENTDFLWGKRICQIAVFWRSVTIAWWEQSQTFTLSKNAYQSQSTLPLSVQNRTVSPPAVTITVSIDPGIRVSQCISAFPACLGWGGGGGVLTSWPHWALR